MIELTISLASLAGICLIFWCMKSKEKVIVDYYPELSEKERNRIMIKKLSEEIEAEFAGSDLIKVMDLFRASQQYIAQQNVDNLIDLHNAVKIATPIFEEVDINEYNEDEYRL